MNTYRVRPDEVRQNLDLLHAFFAELTAAKPDGLSYTAFQLDDEVSFVHIVETERGVAPFAYLGAYQDFRSTVGQRCDRPPAMMRLHMVGSFRSDGLPGTR
jgi:hypothetical protein